MILAQSFIGRNEYRRRMVDAMTNVPRTSGAHDDADVVLIGGGIMSATLGSMLSILEPEWRIVLLERADALATESSGPWNNAGTGHSGFCELNYMPDPADGAKATGIARQFHLSRQWWSYLAENGLLEPDAFIHPAAHMDVVFGHRDIDYLRRRYETLSAEPMFTGIRFSDCPTTIEDWAPLVMRGRAPDEPVAATLHPDGTDVDFGALTRALTQMITDRGAQVRLEHEVRVLNRASDGSWMVNGLNPHGDFTIRARSVFVGAGGHALRILQRARLPEVRGYAVLPVGAAFLRCGDPGVANRHTTKVYGQAPVGAPPMSVPHLDKRLVGGRPYLMFGPYATFSTKLLKHGRWIDFFTTVRWHNMHVIAAALVQNLSLIGYLITQLVAGPRQRFAQLRRYYPTAEPGDWALVPAGQRAQLIRPDRRRVGVLQQGTELVVNADHTIAGLLGASPGASTAVPIMLEALQRCFPERWHTSWRTTMFTAIPGAAGPVWDTAAVTDSVRVTARALGLDETRPSS
ncbi:malate dehydrogenase (acceptor) [Mycobacteroides chelonae]|uniref:Probable malate:quinone oxidoreductase n=2 Tax=Mycobacteriaceae TaxID=1762 RepID=A0A1S1LS62_MYCCH|nr:malate:quinone oxidoreductase [Mycobacteroides sp. H003]KRQ36224.1 malate:quinone oxidoreductase [Mycobacteroides sp. H092]KRQ39080.1 malate:quinone oxidoreductase [Mycobacteroides sp. H101]KRQ48458.1 malate:quinone oxidoreductase [Mycobacteroides sp. H063]KRQ60143.1 malate:quinone oxidoreductase [Mycobacteroides sp. HXVII]KRQ60454.1 malate:quinone oxidoreductase [Mycobacteroides sp. H079]KRQ63047.1 malate:quinone oxidoreductase [Mycobacteroides sp. H070]KRQ77238.1 malate:quinone oxidored